ncbi:MAG: MFS transporter [Deltaproteobacteria bacterium]|nr:MAG: MFS transporter [Deltaproteobacteria bacterium]
MPRETPDRSRFLVLIAALLAVFLGALDALIIGAAMPTIVADLGGLELYSWVFSAYMLARTISLPLFGKLADLYSSKRLFVLAVGIFLIGSVLVSLVKSMPYLVFLRGLQGIGAGGCFALAYIVVSEISAPEERGKMMGLISFVWGVSSVLGPLLGGFIVTYLTWPWVFYINVPIGGLVLFCILRYFRDSRHKKRDVAIDYLGAFALSICVLASLSAVLLLGETYAWYAPQPVSLFTLALFASGIFWYAERRATEPILPLDFFRIPGFTLSNGAAFFSSFAIFSLLAFLPLFVQGTLGRTAAELGIVMVPLSLGWSAGALICGQVINRLGERFAGVAGAIVMSVSIALTLTFNPMTGLIYFSAVVCPIGIGMGFVSVATLLKVQNSLPESDLGIATSSQQFARTLGGTIGIGISGALLSHTTDKAIEGLLDSPLRSEFPPDLATQLTQNLQEFLRPETVASLSSPALDAIRQSIGGGVKSVLWSALLVSFVSIILCQKMPGRTHPQ